MLSVGENKTFTYARGLKFRTIETYIKTIENFNLMKIVYRTLSVKFALIAFDGIPCALCPKLLPAVLNGKISNSKIGISQARIKVQPKSQIFGRSLSGKFSSWFVRFVRMSKFPLLSLAVLFVAVSMAKGEPPLAPPLNLLLPFVLPPPPPMPGMPPIPLMPHFVKAIAVSF